MSRETFADKIRDKRVEEIAKALCYDYKTEKCQLCNDYGKCILGIHAQVIYDSGYRLKVDVARQIFDEIEKVLLSSEYRANTSRKTVKVEELKEQVEWILHEAVLQILAPVKKKYTESEDHQ